MHTNDHYEIEKKLEYKFRSKELLDEALRHSSFVNEQPEVDLRDNERFEFLGDAVLNLIVGHILMEHYTEVNEGDLSRTRANLVNESQLAIIARTIDLGAFIRLGKGEIQTNGRDKNSILAGAFEALIPLFIWMAASRRPLRLSKIILSPSIQFAFINSTAPLQSSTSLE